MPFSFYSVYGVLIKVLESNTHLKERSKIFQITEKVTWDGSMWLMKYIVTVVKIAIVELY